MRALVPLIALAALAGCATTPDGTTPIAAPVSDWRAVATPADRTRLRDWRSSFRAALGRARARGHGAEIDAEGALLTPDIAVAGGPIPNGLYRCRVIKIGAKSEGLLDYVAYPAFQCRIQQERNLQGFAKLSGSQRPVGLIFPSDQLRQVFLGSLVLGDEVRAMQYGRDPDRDVAAWIERVELNRWRMLIPSPRFESLTDVIELIPAT